MKSPDRTVVISATVSVITLIVSLTVLVAEGRDPTQIIAFISPYITLAVPVLLNSRVSIRASQKLDEVSDKVDVVNSNVNGHLTDLSRAAGIRTDGPPDTPDPGK